MAETIPKKDAIVPDDSPHTPHDDQSPVETVQTVGYSGTFTYDSGRDFMAKMIQSGELFNVIARDPKALATFQEMSTPRK